MTRRAALVVMTEQLSTTHLLTGRAITLTTLTVRDKMIDN